ncbi:MAG: phenylalanine--tRNA ligase subunit beta [Deltaproteobacteria bacterium RIFOXYA12_FULL_58_15]|nr:MAG: phenylalanine--tRNA ligase subunit beta [Deltaproteobacteria bacterium RIFOXYA12_FULL_58_15]
MEISYEWLSDFVDPPEIGQLCAELTRAGIEVEEVRDPRPAIAQVSGVVVAEVKSCEAHPSADRLKVCEVFDGKQNYTVVCGAPNVAAGKRVAFARVGATLPGLKITKRAVRNVDSFGMLCSRQELGLGAENAGIWELSKTWELGSDVLAAINAAPSMTVSITPNRPDLLSHLGVAREVAAATGVRRRSSNWRLVETGPGAATLARVVVEDPAGCKRYVARVIRNVKVGPSPDWLKQRLEAVGQRSINNVVDATNYVLHELGQPLHAFDMGRIAAETGLPTIRVRRANPGETLRTLDGEERKLDADDLIIADADRPVALAGVMGGAESEVTSSTKTVLLESAYFDPSTVRRTARRHALHTESSHRFERTADWGCVHKALDRCAQIIAEVAKGEVAKGVLDVSQKIEQPAEISLRLDRVARILGVSFPAETVVQLLDPLEIRCCARNEGALRFQPPTFRPDLTREIDLIEEIARRYGHDAIPDRLPDASGDYRYQPPADDTVERAREALLASGVSEAVTWGFGSPDAYLNGVGTQEVPLRLKNPLGEEMSALRTSLLPGLLAVLRHNQRHGAKSLKLFEVGTTFHARKSKADEDERDRALPLEVLRVAVVMWGERHEGRWYQGNEHIDFSDLSGVVDNLGAKLQVVIAKQPKKAANLHPFATAELSCGGEVLGIAGQLHPEKSDSLELTGPVYVAELSFNALKLLGTRPITYQPLPKHPGTRRDLAVVVGDSVPAEDIRCYLAENAGGGIGKVIERVWLFDVYRGEGIEKSKVSLAFAIEYRHPDRTLTDAEVNQAFEKVIANLKKEFALEVRG